MAQINCFIEKRYLSIEPAVNITTGSIGSIQCSFSFDGEWGGLQKTAIFKASDGQTYPVLITDGACTVPYEAIADGCYITMGVMGTKDGNVVVATEWKNGDLNTGCYTAIAPPSEDIYLQILNEFSTSTARVEAAADKIQQSADEIQAGLPAIHQDAETAKEKAAEATAAAGEAAKSRDKAKEYQDAAQASAADALASAQGAAESEENVAAMQNNVQELANQVAADKADVAAKAQTVAAQAQQVQETADGFPAVADAAKNAVTAEGTKQIGLVSGEGTKQVKAVADKGAEQVAAVNEAGAAQISAATAQADRAQQEADRAEQEANRAESIDAYTKVDSRQAFANAFVGEKAGAMVSLPDVAEGTLLRKAAIQGETTEVLANPEVEKSPDNIASISGVEPTKLAACGKNLFDMDDFFSGETRTFRGITYTKTPDGILTNGTAEGMSYVDPYNMTSALKVGKTYTVSANDPKIVPRFEIIREGTSNLYKEKHTVDGTETKINVYFYFADGTAVSNLVVQFQLEEGAAATAYEPYFGTDYPLPTLEPLMSLPNGVCDEYDAVTGVETRRIGKLALNGTETFTVGTHSNGQAYASFVIPVHAKADSLPISTHYLASQWTNANNRIYVPSYMGFVITDSRFTSKAIAAEILAAQYAAGMPVTVYYELSEPIIIQHTPTAIPAIYPATNIYSDQGNISVTYNRDSNQVYRELTDSLGGKVDKVSGEKIMADVDDIKAYLGYIDEDIVGICVDYKNKVFKRLAGACDRTAGADFDQFEMFGGRKRCNVADDGTITAYYGDDGYIEDGSKGQVMVYQPAFYYRVVPLEYDRNTQSGIGYHLRKANYYVSSIPKVGFKLHPAFYDKNGNPVKYILLSAYEASLWQASTSSYVNDGTDNSTTWDLTADRICSVAGKKPISGLYKLLTKPNLETIAANRGDGWHGDLIKAESANQLLMLIELGMMNTQTAIGQGITSITDNAAYNCGSLTGSTSALGNATGSAASTINEKGGVQTTETAAGKVSITYRGMENSWGNLWKHVNGINIWGDGTMGGGQPFVSDDFIFNESKRDGNYKPVGFTLANADGYINAMGYGGEEYDWLFMPSEVGGTSVLPVGDYFYKIADLNGYRIARLGGGWYGGSVAGGFYWSCSNGVGGRDRAAGGRLVYVPTVY